MINFLEAVTPVFENNTINFFFELVRNYYPQVIALVSGNYVVIKIINLLVNVITKKIQTTSFNDVNNNIDALFKGKEEELILTVQESIAVANLDLKNDLLKENTEANNQILAFQNTILSAPENVELRVKYEKKLSEGRNKLKNIQLEYERNKTSIIENIKELREKSKKELKKELAVIKKIKNKRKKKSKKNTKIEIKGVLENDTENKISLT